MEVVLPRIVAAEFNTHRMLSRNSASSRAIPVEKRIATVKADPFIPTTFGRNQKGMQASENLDENDSLRAEQVWRQAVGNALSSATELASIGVHKQLANRILEPFCWHTIICSGTEWQNYFALRCHPDAQPEIKKASELMEVAYNTSTPELVEPGGWHLPLVYDLGELLSTGYTMEEIKKVSIGRCARVSYLTHDGTKDPRADIVLCNRLMASGHMSPFEHVARPMIKVDCKQTLSNLGIRVQQPESYEPSRFFSGNFRGWVQARKEIANEGNYRCATITQEPKNP